MPGALDHALASLALARRLLDRSQLHALRDQGPLAEAIARRRLLPAATLRSLLAELAALSFSCKGCRSRYPSSSLSQLDALRCPACGGALSPGEPPPPSSRAWPAVNAADSRAGTHGFPLRPAPTGRSGTLPLGTESTHRTEQPPGSPPAPGERLGPYLLLQVLGKGSFGAVYLARREGLERRFALKVLLAGEDADEEAVARFGLEAAVASKVDDPGSLSVFDIGRDRGFPYYVMEYCPGETLKDRLRRQGRLPPEEAARTVLSLARTMSNAHARGVVHRDLKPSNVILEEGSGRPRITDFGLARDRSLLRSMTQTGDLLGTPHYMSPEQFRGEKDIDHRADIYALGVILYECLTGRLPHTAETALDLADKVCTQLPRHPCELDPSLPRGLADVALRAMAPHPDDRYPSADALAEDLERSLSGKRPLAAARARPHALAFVGGAVAALLVTAALLALREAGRRESPTGAPPPTGAPAHT
ncbi:MAG: serine/threonine protein kinase, partial [Planctomycetota bacterium]